VAIKPQLKKCFETISSCSGPSAIIIFFIYDEDPEGIISGVCTNPDFTGDQGHAFKVSFKEKMAVIVKEPGAGEVIDYKLRNFASAINDCDAVI